MAMGLLKVKLLLWGEGELHLWPRGQEQADCQIFVGKCVLDY